MNPDRMKKAAPAEGLSGGSFGGATPESAAPAEVQAAPAVPAAPAALPLDVGAVPITGELDPVITEALAEIPDRPKQKAAPAVTDEPAAPVADDQEQPAPRRVGVLVAIGGASIAGLVLLLASRRSGAAPAGLGSPEPVAPTAPAAPAAVRSSGVVIG